MASLKYFISFLFLICSTFIPSKSHSINSINGGFTLSLVHRDSPHSPFYNHSMNPYERRVASAQRSTSRLKHLSLHADARATLTPQSNNPDTSSKLIPDNLEYIASYYIGTLPTKVDAFIDTGSDITWTKAQPTFDSSASSSYTNLSCISPDCLNLGDIRTCPSYADEICTYDMVYADGAMSYGILGNDKFLFDASNDYHNLVDVGFITFGVNNESSPHFKGKQNGCLALSRGKFSFITQLGIKKFSHCFVTPDDVGSGSRMYFGTKAVIYASDLTPLVESKDSLYYVKLEGIGVGETRVEIPRKAYGGTVVDAGSSNTMLTSTYYDPFLNMIRKFVKKPVVKGPSGEFELCYEGTYNDLANIPLVTFHFTNVDLRLMHDVTFAEYGEGVWCLAILRSASLVQSVIGNIQMRNLWVGYDLDRNGISFTNADCPTF